jgi:uncharacterized damage-inducible protein DinB
MSALDQIRRLWEHCVWADDTMIAAILGGDPPTTVIREYAHIIGAEEVWLSRLEGRTASLAVWPELTREELATAARDIRTGYTHYLAALGEEDLTKSVSYTNTAGRSFVTPIRDILLHVTLHGHYHRGKVNLLLRQSNLSPSPVDFIAFARGVPAARTDLSTR